MNFYDKLKIYESISGANYWSKRIGAELQYLSNISAGEDGVYNGQIEKALDFLLEAHNLNAAVTKDDALKAEELLAPLAETAKSYTAICVAHAHIDMNWSATRSYA